MRDAEALLSCLWWLAPVRCCIDGLCYGAHLMVFFDTILLRGLSKHVTVDCWFMSRHIFFLAVEALQG